MSQGFENLWDGVPMVARADLAPEKTGLSAAVFLNRADIRAAAARLMEKGYHLEDITGLDYAEGIEVRYHFATFEAGSRLALRVLLSHENPELASICDLVPAAEWHERECFDFFGVKFTGHPRLRPILLPPDLGFHPLVKEEKARVSLYEMMETYPPMAAAKGETYVFEKPEAEGKADESSQK